MKRHEPTAAEIAARSAVLAAIKPHADEIGADRMLAVLAYTVGQMLALQDQRTMTVAMAMALISQNIEMGNLHAIEARLGRTEGQG